MSLLGLLGAGRGAVHPQRAERNPSRHGGTDAGDPGPRAADDIATRPLVVRHVADRDRVLLLDVGEERPLVVHLEVEDAVLVGELERRDKDGSVGRGLRDVVRQRQAVERRQHGELELQLVVGGDGERLPCGPGPLRDGDGVGLKKRVAVLA